MNINLETGHAEVIVRELTAAFAVRVKHVMDLQAMDAQRYARSIDRAWSEAREIDEVLGTIMQQVHGYRHKPTFFVPLHDEAKAGSRR